jgi:hypothetical protein
MQSQEEEKKCPFQTTPKPHSSGEGEASHLQSKSKYTSTHQVAIAQLSDTKNNTLEKIPLLFCCCTQLTMKSAFYISANRDSAPNPTLLLLLPIDFQ